MKRIAHVILSLCLAADLTFAVGVAGGAVLCIGAEGHVAIESATASCSDLSAPEDFPEGQVSVRSEARSPGGNCTDIPISGAGASTVAKKVSRNAGPHHISVAGLCAVQLGVEKLPGDGRSPPSRLLPPASAPTLRSVVLLI